MSDINAIKEVRERSGVGLGECKSALEEAYGDVEEALVVLQKRGVIRVAKSASKEANEGYIYSYTHSNGKVAVLAEVNCQTDFSAHNETFREFCEQVGLQIAAMNPKYLTSGDVPEDVLNKQRDIFRAQVLDKVPDNKVDHIINGKLKKWFGEICLMDQKSVLVTGKTVEQLRADLVMKIKENIVVKRFVRWEVGE